MPREYKFWYDIDKHQLLSGPITFEPVKAGEITSKFIYVENTIKFPITFDFILKDTSTKDIKLGKVFKKLNPKEIGIVELIYSPKLTLMHPIQAILECKFHYLVE